MKPQSLRQRRLSNYGPFLGYKGHPQQHLCDECWHSTHCSRISGKELHKVLASAAEDINSRMVKVLFETVVAYLFHSRRIKHHLVQKTI